MDKEYKMRFKNGSEITFYKGEYPDEIKGSDWDLCLVSCPLCGEMVQVQGETTELHACREEIEQSEKP